MRFPAIRKRTLWVVVSMVIVGGGLVAAGVARGNKPAKPADAGKQPTQLEFVANDLTRVEPAALRRLLPVSGSLQPVRQTMVKAKVSGEVRSVAVRDGEVIAGGQTLAQFDTTDLGNRLQERVGSLDATRAQLAWAEKNRQSNEALLKQGFISQNRYDEISSSYQNSRGQTHALEAGVALARTALNDATVRAPFDGVIAKKHVQAGEKVSFDAPLFTVVDLTVMELQALIPASDIPQVKVGMPVALKVDGFGDREFTGHVERINPTTEPGTRSILVFVSLKNADQVLKGGMFASGQLAIGESAPLPTLPETAIRSDASQPYVWGIHDGKLVKYEVTLGQRDEQSGRVEIKGGVPKDVAVLLAKMDNLRAGNPALIKTTAAAVNLPADTKKN